MEEDFVRQYEGFVLQDVIMDQDFICFYLYFNDSKSFLINSGLKLDINIDFDSLISVSSD